jgi:hypothetical protein
MGVGGGGHSALVESAGAALAQAPRHHPVRVLGSGELGPGESMRGQMALHIFTQRKLGLWDQLGHKTVGTGCCLNGIREGGAARRPSSLFNIGPGVKIKIFLSQRGVL